MSEPAPTELPPDTVPASARSSASDFSPAPDNEALVLVVVRVLQVGIAISASLILLGLLGSLVVGWNGSLVGASPGGDPTDVGALVAGLQVLRPQAIAQLGLLTLILTPVMRVGASLLLFVVERDRIYIVISIVVLAILLTSLLLIR